MLLYKITLVFLSCLAFIESAKYKNAFQVIKMGMCDDNPKDSYFNIENIQLTNKEVGTRIFCNFNISKSIQNLEAVIILNKCKSLENLDSCEKWSPIRTRNACKYLTQSKGQPWDKLMNDISPPFKCPIEKGYYTVNGTMEMGKMPILLPVSLGNDYWQSKVQFMEGKKIISAICLVFHITRYKIKD